MQPGQVGLDRLDRSEEDRRQTVAVPQLELDRVAGRHAHVGGDAEPGVQRARRVQVGIGFDANHDRSGRGGAAATQRVRHGPDGRTD